MITLVSCVSRAANSDLCDADPVPAAGDHGKSGEEREQSCPRHSLLWTDICQLHSHTITAPCP